VLWRSGVAAGAEETEAVLVGKTDEKIRRRADAAVCVVVDAAAMVVVVVVVRCGVVGEGGETRRDGAGGR
jgi:hypothetical protein